MVEVWKRCNQCGYQQHGQISETQSLSSINEECPHCGSTENIMNIGFSYPPKLWDDNAVVHPLELRA